MTDLATSKEPLSLRGRATTHYFLAWSPDGRQVASARAFLNKSTWENEIKVWDTRDNNRLIRTLPWGSGAARQLGGDVVNQLAWSPSSRQVAASGTGSAKIWEVATGKEALGFRMMGPPGSWLSWAPDGRRLAAGNAFKAQVWDTATGKEVLTAPLLGPGSITMGKWAPWSPDGRRLAFSDPDWTVRILDPTAAKETLTLGRSRGATRTGITQGPLLHNRVMLAWSVDGQRLASSSSLLSTIQLWDPASGAKLLTLPGHGQEIRSLAWSRDGRRLASAGEDGAVKVWDVTGSKEIISFVYVRPPHALTTSPKPATESLLAWSTDARQLAVAGGDGSVTVWDVITGKEVIKLSGLQPPAYSVDWSTDGRRLAAVGGDGTVILWDADTGQHVLTLRAPLSPTPLTVRLAWSPDCRRLALSDEDAVDTTVTIWDSIPAAQLRPGN